MPDEHECMALGRTNAMKADKSGKPLKFLPNQVRLWVAERIARCVNSQLREFTLVEEPSVIPRVARSGQSFEGAGQYYLHDKVDGQQRLSTSAKNDFKAVGDYALHDKVNRQTAYRVGFTSMLNMQADSPEEAIGQMTASYDRFREREKNKRGRKLTKPVYVYSLSWAPDQTPDQAEMMAAAQSSLKALRLEGLQTLIVQHTDEPHPHIHVIVNRIELDGSRARNIAFDQLRFSRWAEQYERDNGGIRCEQRVRNNELRRKGVMVKDTSSLSRAHYTAREANDQEQLRIWRDQQEAFRKATQASQRTQLWTRQDRERMALEAKTQARIADKREAAKEKFRPQWRELYKQQGTQARIVDKVNKGGIFERACFVFANRAFLEKAGKLRVRDLAWLCVSKKALRKRVEAVHRGERKALSQWEKKLSDGAVRVVWQTHAVEFRELRARQQLERDVQAYTLKCERENAMRAVEQTARARAPAKAEPPPQEEPVHETIPARPELGPGTSIDVPEIKSLLSDSPGIKNAFANAAKPDAAPDPVADLEKRMARFKRAHPNRDFGRKRRP